MRTKAKFLILTFGLVLFISIVVPLSLVKRLNYKEAILNYNHVKSNSNSFKHDSGLMIVVESEDFDAQKRELSMSYSVFAFGNLTTKQVSIDNAMNEHAELSQNISLQFDDKTITLKAGKPTKEQIIRHYTSQGDISLYPTDSYSFEWQLSASSQNQTIPIWVGIQNDLSLLNFDDKISSDEFRPVINIGIVRSAECKVYVALVNLMMWILALLMFAVASSMWIRKQVEAKMVYGIFAVFYSLPKLRKLQPGIPTATGLLSDAFGYYYCMLIVGVATGLALVRYAIIK